MTRILRDKQWHQWDSAIIPAMQRMRGFIQAERKRERKNVEALAKRLHARAMRERRKLEYLLRSARNQRKIIRRFMRILKYQEREVGK